MNKSSAKKIICDETRLWEVADVCHYLGLGKSKVYEKVATNDIPHVYIDSKLRFIPEQIKASPKKWQTKQSAS